MGIEIEKFSNWPAITGQKITINQFPKLIFTIIIPNALKQYDQSLQRAVAAEGLIEFQAPLARPR